MMQYSIYSKIFPNRDTVKWHRQDLERHLPPDGSVMVLTVTEKQYQSIQNLVGSKKALDRKITSKTLLTF
jgi:CRISPR-associated protein Cas2